MEIPYKKSIIICILFLLIIFVSYFVIGDLKKDTNIQLINKGYKSNLSDMSLGLEVVKQDGFEKDINIKITKVSKNRFRIDYKFNETILKDIKEANSKSKQDDKDIKIDEIKYKYYNNIQDINLSKSLNSFSDYPKEVYSSIINVTGKIDLNKEGYFYIDLVNYSAKDINKFIGEEIKIGYNSLIIKIVASYYFVPSVAISSNGMLNLVLANGTTFPYEILYFNNTGNTWNYTKIKDFAVLYDSTLGIAIDSNGLKHVSFVEDNSEVNLSFIVYCNDTKNTWDCINITYSDSAYMSSMAIDTNDIVHIAYSNNNAQNLSYCNNTGNTWDCTTLLDYYCGSPNLISDLNDILHLTCQNEIGGFENFSLRYCNNTGGTWNCSTVDDSDVYMGYAAAMDIDSNGLIHVLHYDNWNYDLRYCNNTGNTWNCTIVESDGDVGDRPSIAIDSQNVIHLTNYDFDDEDYRYCNSTNKGGTWNCIKVADVTADWLGYGRKQLTVKKGRLADSTDYSEFLYGVYGSNDSTYLWRKSLDDTYPKISVVYPSNNSKTYNTTLDIKYKYTESYCANVTWQDGVGSNTTLASCGTNITTATWGQGKHNLTIFMRDTSNNLNRTYISFLLDLIFPHITFESPTPIDNAYTSSSTQTITANITDNLASNTSSWIDFNSNLRGYWSMDSYNSTDAYDNSTYRNYGTFKGGLGINDLVQGPRGKAMEFDGSNDMISVLDDSKLEAFNDTTISLWIYINKYGVNDFFVGKEGVYKLDFGGTVANIRFLTGENWAGSILTSTKVLDTKKWYNIVAVYNGTQKMIYFNGVKDATTVATRGGVRSNSNNFTIGGRWSADYFNGSIDEVMIFNYSLSQDEVLALYDSKANKFNASFTDLYALDYNYTVYAIDESGNLNSSSRSFFPDIAPKITFISPTPTNGSTVNSIAQTIVANVTDDLDVSALIDFDNSLMGYWSFDEYNNTRVGDNSSWKRHGTYNGGANVTNFYDGVRGKAMYFDGTDDSLTFSCTNMFYGYDNFTISYWQYPIIRVSQTPIAFGWNYGDNLGMGLRPDANGNYGIFFGNSWYSLGYNYSKELNEWNMLTVVHNNRLGITYLYRNGVLNTTTTTKILPFVRNGGTCNIGDENTNEFQGYMDEMIVFNRTLSAKEIKALYNTNVNNLTIILNQLQPGKHNYTVYAIDAEGNMNYSKLRSFNVSATYTLNITLPTESLLTSTSSGKNISIYFNFLAGLLDITSLVNIDDIYIGGTRVTILNNTQVFYISSGNSSTAAANPVTVSFTALPNTSYSNFMNPLSDNKLPYSLEWNSKTTTTYTVKIENDTGGNEVAKFMYAQIPYGYYKLNETYAIYCGIRESGDAASSGTFDQYAMPSTSYSVAVANINDDDSPCTGINGGSGKTIYSWNYEITDDAGDGESTGNLPYCVFTRGEYNGFSDLKIKAGTKTQTAGNLSVIFTTAFTDSNYVVFLTHDEDDGGDVCRCKVIGRNTTAFRASCFDDDGLNATCNSDNYDWVAFTQGYFKEVYTTKTKKVGFISTILGWQVNVTVPSFVSGIKNLFVNATFFGKTRSDTENLSIEYNFPKMEPISPTPNNDSYINYNNPTIKFNITDETNISVWIDRDRTLVSYISMENYNKTVVYDNSSFNNFTKIVGGMNYSNFTTAIRGNSLDFDGVNDALNFSNMGTPAGATISFWFYKPVIDSGGQYIMDGRNGAGTGWWFIQDYTTGPCTDTAGNICFNGLVQIKSGNFTANKWYHVTLTMNSTQTRLYLNGVLKSSGAGVTPQLTRVIVGTRYTSSGWFRGKFDEIMIFKRVLLPTEVSSLYDAKRYMFNVTAVLSQGNHNYTIYSIDEGGHINKSSMNFSIDSIAPKISIYQPYNNTNTTNTSTDIEYKYTEIHCDNVTWSDNNGVNTTLASCGTNVTIPTWAEGKHNVTVFMRDTLNNVNYSSIRFRIDAATTPKTTFLTPTPTNYLNSSSTSQTIKASTSDLITTSTFVDFDNSLVGYWNFNRYNSSGIFDNSTYNNFGSFSDVSISGINYGVRGNSFLFDGSTNSNGITVNNDVSIDDLDSFTLSYWIRPTSTSSATYPKTIGKGYYGGGGWLTDAGNSVMSQQTLWFGSDSGWSGQASYSVTTSSSTWTYVTFVVNRTNGNSYAYKNGVLVTGPFTLPTYYNTNVPLYIGREKFKGDLDEVMLFNRTLSVDEILSLYNSKLYTYNSTFSGLGEGRHNYTIYSIDSAGNFNSTARTFTTDFSAPDINLTVPYNTTYTSTNNNLTSTLSDNFGIKNATLNIYNSTGNLVNTTIINFASGIVIKTLGVMHTFTNGVYTWFVKVFDWASNSDTSVNYTITMDNIYSKIAYDTETATNYANLSQDSIYVNITLTETNFANMSYNLYNGSVPIEGLVGWWAFDENQLTQIDSSYNKKHGIVVNGATYNSSGKLGGAYSFDGVNDYINISNLTWTPTTFTVSWWMYPLNCKNYNQMIGHGGGTSWGRFTFHTDSNCAVYTGTDTSTRFTPTDLPANTLTKNYWQLFTYTYNGTHGRFYKNGILLAGPKAQTASLAWNNGFKVGSTAGTSEVVNGSIDEVRIYNRSLSQTEITEIYNSRLINKSDFSPTILTSSEYITFKDISAQASTPTGLFFKPDGKRMYVIDYTSDRISQYYLSVPWDISTAYYQSNFTVTTWEATPHDLFISPDGTKFYTCGDAGTDEINYFTLGTAWDITTASFVSSFVVDTREPGSLGVSFSSDGSKMYLVGFTSDRIHEWNLTTPWNISTAVYVTNISVLAQSGGMSSLNFNEDGTKLFAVGLGGVEVKMIYYTLNTAWNISTLNYVNSYYVINQDSSMSGSYMKSDLTKFYTVGYTNDRVYSYSISRPQKTINWTNLDDGTYYYNVYVNDKANNQNSTLTRRITLDTSSPGSINLTSPTNNTFTNNLSVNLTTEASDETGIKNITFNIYNLTSGNLLNTTTFNFASYTLTKTMGVIHVFTDGVYKWFTKTFDWAGNSAVSSNFTLTIDTIKDRITFKHPTPPHNSYLKSIIITANATDNSAGNTSTWVDMDNSLVGYWSMDSYNSTGIYDNSTYNNFGVFGGGLNLSGLVFGKRGKGINFDGTNDYIDCQAIQNVSKSKAYTISLWVKVNSDDVTLGKNLIENIISTSDRNTISYRNGFINAGIYDGSSYFVKKSGALQTGTWAHILYTFDGSSTLNLYINNVAQVGTGSPYTDGTAHFRIGGRMNAGSFFNGSIDEVMVFSRVLSTNEISALYNSKVDNFNTSFDSLSEGVYNYTIYSIDSAGNLNSSRRGFIIDLTKPIINFLTPTPANNTNLSSSTQTITINATDNSAGNTSTWVDMDNSLVGYWSMDSYNSTGIYDNSSYDNFCTFSNGISTSNLTTGARGKALIFNNSNYLDCGNDISLNSTSSFTISAWVYASKIILPESIIVTRASADGTTTNWRFMAKVYSGGSGVNWGFRVDSSVTESVSNSQLSLNRWYNLIVTYDGTTVRFYKNGLADGNDSKTNLLGSSQPVKIARGIGGAQRYFNGTIDEVMIFNRTLSADEIAALYNSKVNNYNNTFTGLSQGRHNYTLYTIDQAGNLNSSARGFTIDTSAPDINFTYPLNNTYNATTNQNLTAEVSDNIGIKNITFNIYNLTSGNLLNTTTFNFASYTLIKTMGVIHVFTDGIYEIFTKVFDWAGNSDTTNNYTLTIDTTSPIINIVYPTLNYFNSTLYDLSINYTFFDINTDSCWWTDNLGVVNNSIPSCGINVTGPWVQGINNLRIYINDSAGNEVYDSIYFTIDATNPDVNLTKPLNNTYNATNSQNLTSSISDNLGIKNATLYIYNTSNNLVNSTTKLFGANLLNKTLGVFHTFTDGVWKWFVKVYDWSGNSDTTNNYTLNIDTTNPIIRITSPVNNTNTSDTLLDIKYRYTEINCKNVTWNDNSGANTTLALCGTNITTINWTEGKHNITLFMRDKASNLGKNYSTFTIDTINPNMTISNTNNTLEPLGDLTVKINYTATDTHLRRCYFTLRNSAGAVHNYPENNSLNCSATSRSISALYFGTFVVQFWAEDYAGNLDDANFTFRTQSEGGGGGGDGGQHYTMKPKLNVSLRVHYYNNGFDYLPNRTDKYNSSFIYDGISFEIIGNNSGDYNLNVSVFYALPIEFMNALSNESFILRKREEKVLWKSKIIFIENFTKEEEYAFFVKVEGNYSDRSIYANDSMWFTFVKTQNKTLLNRIGDIIWEDNPLAGILVLSFAGVILIFVYWRKKSEKEKKLKSKTSSKTIPMILPKEKEKKYEKK